MKLFCVVDDCSNFFDVKDYPLSAGAKFTCRDHIPPGPDDVRFQEAQFDPDLVSGGTRTISPQVDFGDEASWCGFTNFLNDECAEEGLKEIDAQEEESDYE